MTQNKVTASIDGTDKTFLFQMVVM